MNYNQIIDEILLYAKMEQRKNRFGEYRITIEGLFKYFEKKYPQLDHRPIQDMIDEIDARGWLLEIDSSIIEFDPATFN